MRLYFAGIERGIFVKSEYAKQLYSLCVSTGVKYALTSYYYVKDDPDYLTRKNKIPKIFLDSGAYSAHHSGAEINLEAYCKFIQDYSPFIETYANLDVIGNAEETYKNQQTMEKAGLHPLPTFHIGEDFKWLDRYVDAGYKYIALGGLVRKHHNMRAAFLRKCFEIIPPDVKVHGYGMTSSRLLAYFPWYSVDSINWLMGEMRGTLYKYDHGRIKNLKLGKKVRPFTGDHMSADNWNVIQWKKYADYLETIGKWKGE